MFTQEENDRLTRVGAGTPMGDLMRRWWHPIAGVSELLKRPTKAVRLLGEDLVLYRTPRGKFGLIEQRCLHRSMDMLYGLPEDEGIRCAYHGWVYDFAGQCIEQPAEPPGSVFKDKVQMKSYPAEELGDLVWAYLGPKPVPLLPRWDMLVWENVTRVISACVLPCNWLQAAENALDQTHVEWLHGYYGSYAAHLDGRPWQESDQGHHLRLGYDRFDYGIIKRRITSNTTGEDDEHWSMGHPLVLPAMLRQGYDNRHTFLIRVPIDDEHTWHIRYEAWVPEPDATVQHRGVTELKEIEILGPDGRIIDDTNPAQDILAWIGQGPISDRTRERLGVGDVGVIMFRRLLEEQLQLVKDGGDPMCVFRDPKRNQCVVLPQERTRYPDEASLAAAHAWDNFGTAETEAVLDSEGFDIRRARARLYERRATHGFVEGKSNPVIG